MLRMAAAALLLASAPAWAADYTIMAPAAPGGGWDQTARSMQTALVADGISDKVEVVNAPGAGGTVGLIRFAQDSRGNPEDLIVAGYVMVGAILVNHSPIDLGMVTPIARLTGEQEAIVVPATSPIRDIDDLIVMLKADPQWVAWGGGSAGGVDHILAAKVANAVGDPGVRRSDGSPPMSAVQINYVPHSGGGEVAAALRDNKVTVGVSGIGEFESEIEAGHLRVLAVSGEERVPGVDAPTLKEAGIDVALENWRMVAAPPGLTEAQTAAISADIARLVGSEAWKKELEAHGWADRYLVGPEFEKQLAAEVIATRQVLIELGLIKLN